MKKSKALASLLSLLLAIALTLCVAPMVSASGTPDTIPFAAGPTDEITVGSVTVTGEVGTALDSPVDVVLTANNDGFAASTAGEDVSNWIFGLPDGLTAKIKSAVTAGEASLTIEIDGTPTETSDDFMGITVPATALVGATSSVTWSRDSSVKFDITDPNAASAMVSGGSVTGTVGAALSGPVDITITITNDDLKAAITAGDDLSGWILNLPDGLTAVAKSDAAINTTSVTITINGTPTGWCAEPMDIRIPAAALTKGAAVDVTVNTSVKITIPDPDNSSGGGGGGGNPDPGDGDDDDDDDDNNNSSGGGYTSDRDDDDDDDDSSNRNDSSNFWGSLLGGREQNTPVTVTTQSAASAMDSAVEAALAAGDDTATATIRNAGEISLSTLRSMANQSDMAVKLNADSMSADGKSVEVRVTLDPAQSTQDINLFASTTNDDAQTIEDRFERFYTNNVSVVHFDQQGDFGQTVSVAVRIDPALNTDSLRFYAYDKAANTYRPIETTYWLDANGYVHFSTTRAGDIVITDAPLAK